MIGATEVIENNLNHLSRIPGQHDMHNIQRSAILGITHILRKSTSHVGRLDSKDIPTIRSPRCRVYT